MRNLLTTCLAFLLALPLSVSAAALEATSPGINVLDLPQPQISGIDAAKNIVYLTIDVDPDASADFRADVMVEDSDGNILEVSPQIAVTDPENIQVPIRTTLQKWYKITPEITNNSIKNTGSGGIHSEAPVEDPSSIPETPPETVIVRDTNTVERVRTEYIVTEATPEQVVVEKMLKVDKPVYITEAGGKAENDMKTPADSKSRPDYEPDASDTDDISQPVQSDFNARQFALVTFFVIIVAFVAGVYINHWVESGKKSKKKGERQ